MNSDTWKASEREIAKRLNDQIIHLFEGRDEEDGPVSKRVPVTGRAMGSAPDATHPWYSLEIKHGRSLPVFFLKAMRQAEAAVRKNQIPVVVFHEHGARYDDCLVMIKLKDLETFRSYGRPDFQSDSQPHPDDL